MKENKNTGGRERSEGAESNTAAVTSDPTQSSDSKLSRIYHQSKRQVNRQFMSRALQICVWALRCPVEVG